MKTILSFIICLILCNTCIADETILLFYPSNKYAEMSGGLPARLEANLSYENQAGYKLQVDEDVYRISMLDHEDCNCDLLELDYFRFAWNKSFLYLDGHFMEIKFIQP